MTSSYNPLAEKLTSFTCTIQNLEKKEDELLLLRKQLEESLEIAIAYKSKLVRRNELSKLTQQLKDSIVAAMENWSSGWEERGMMRVLSDNYSDRVIILVFGKVNAGKSSFCNYIAEIFPEDQVKKFCFAGGTLEYFTEKFSEGIIETTSQIQGIEIGSKLVILDTPGLHSVTDANDALTRKFVDSADSILWLSPSISPGQIQELADLQYELENKKPLQPIITRSDKREEDIDDEGNFVECITNKTSENRQLQEDDVFQRAKEKLARDIPLKYPVSISVHAYKNSARTRKDQEDAGLSRVLDVMAELLDDGAAFKGTKASNEVVNYLNNSVLAPLKANVVDQLIALDHSLEQQKQQLMQRNKTICSEVVLDVCAEVPKIVDEFKDSQDADALSKVLNTLIQRRITSVVRRELADFSSSFKKIESGLSSQDIGTFEDITVSVERVSGEGAAAATGAAGAAAGVAAGAAIGSAIPIVGTLVGGFLGGLVGKKLGEAVFVETHLVTEVVGVSTGKVIQKITGNVEKYLPVLIQSVVDDIQKNLDEISRVNRAVRKAISVFESEVVRLRGI